MSMIHDLGRRQLEQCLDEAMTRQAPLTLSTRCGDRWLNLHTRILQRSGAVLWLEQPSAGHDAPADAVAPAGGSETAAGSIPAGTVVSLTFKLHHYKHLFTSPVSAACDLQLDNGQKVRAFAVASPLRMQRVQRRAYLRADVPRDRSILATFWLGDSPTPPAGLSCEGWVTNLSAGGFQLRLTARTAPVLEEGDLVQVRLELGQDYGTVQAQAQFRHLETDPRGVCLLGFQLVGLNETSAGRDIINWIGEIVQEFLKASQRHRVA